MIETPMFEGSAVNLTAIDPDTDSHTISAWTQDMDIARLLVAGQPRALAPFEVRKLIEGMQKESEEAGTSFVFGIELREDGRTVGILRLNRINWTHTAGRIEIIVGEPVDQLPAFADALALGLRYAFAELNLYRLTAATPEYAYDRIDRLEEAGFVLELRLREFIYRADRLWDQLHYGILQSEWQCKNVEAQR